MICTHYITFCNSSFLFSKLLESRFSRRFFSLSSWGRKDDAYNKCYHTSIQAEQHTRTHVAVPFYCVICLYHHVQNTEDGADMSFVDV